MTKAELRERLRKGAIMDDLFEFREGQECWIFKAPEFEPGENILYIPDTDLNDIPIAEHHLRRRNRGDYRPVLYRQ